MANIIIGEISYMVSDHTYYLSHSSSIQYLAGNTIEETINNLIENGFTKSFGVQRGDYFQVDSWWKGDYGIAFWDNDINPVK